MNIRDKILVIAAHPDDEVLGCGGTIARARSEGADVRVVFLAEGVMARFDPTDFFEIHVREKSARRNANAVKALARLGVPSEEVFLSDRPCCRLDTIPQIELVKDIENHIRQFEPRCIVTHAANDTNIDHRTAHVAVLAAARPIWPFSLEILAFEVLSSTEWNTQHPFAPNLFIDITPHLADKIAALGDYEDEMRAAPHPRSEAALRALAVFRGVQAGMTSAEAFQVIRTTLPLRT